MYSTIPYHNVRHAFEVFQMTAIMVNIMNLRNKYNELDIKLLLISALCHDVSHIGLSNMDIESINCDIGGSSSSSSSSDNIANITSDSSYNEDIHINNTLKLIYKHKQIFKNYISDMKYINNMITSLILCTDLSLHNSYLKKYKSNVYDKTLLNLVIKISDISHPLRHFKIHNYWVYKFNEETKSKLITPHHIGKDTLWFINTFLLEPLEMLTRDFKSLRVFKTNLNCNIKIWKSYE
tara:strand:- start:749 stop:1459 length:711 start_codon:yes stop_codon:yes gene_type:complete